MEITKNKNIIIGSISCVAYAFCYTGRNVLSALMPQLSESNVFSQNALASMASSILLFYGIGQLINGLLGNRVPAKHMVMLGLMICGILLIAFPYVSNINVCTILWCVVGFSCSMLWGPITKIIGENLSKNAGHIAMTCLTGASIVGILITYILAIFGSRFNNYKMPFTVSGIILIIAGLSFYIIVSFLEKSGMIRPIRRDRSKSGISLDIKTFLNIGFISMLLVCMLNGVIRNAVTFWIPTFISQNFNLGSDLAATISTALPFINLLGSVVGMIVYNRLLKNEKKISLIMFLFAILMFIIVYLCGANLIWLSLTSLFLACAAMTAVCNMVFSIYVLHYTDTGKISGITGLFDFSSYMSASGASLIFPYLLKNNNWTPVISTWLLTAVLGAIFATIAIKTDKAELRDN